MSSCVSKNIYRDNGTDKTTITESNSTSLLDNYGLFRTYIEGYEDLHGDYRVDRYRIAIAGVWVQYPQLHYNSEQTDSFLAQKINEKLCDKSLDLAFGGRPAAYLIDNISTEGFVIDLDYQVEYADDYVFSISYENYFSHPKAVHYTRSRAGLTIDLITGEILSLQQVIKIDSILADKMLTYRIAGEGSDRNRLQSALDEIIKYNTKDDLISQLSDESNEINYYITKNGLTIICPVSFVNGDSFLFEFSAAELEWVLSTA
jgi:hypothetical protein